MKIIIEHYHDKREINGPFNLCASREDFTLIRDAITKWLDNGSSYGWLDIVDTVAARELSTSSIETTLVHRQRHIADTKPSSWSDRT